MNGILLLNLIYKHQSKVAFSFKERKRGGKRRWETVLPLPYLKLFNILVKILEK